MGERLRLGGLKLRERGGTGGSLEKVKLTGGPGLSAGERERGRGRRPAGPGPGRGKGARGKWAKQAEKKEGGRKFPFSFPNTFF